MKIDASTVNEENRWRVQSGGESADWARSPFPRSEKSKYLIISADTHISPPAILMRERVDIAFRERVPRMERDEKGQLWTIVEGRRPALISEAALVGEDAYRAKAGSSSSLDDSSNDIDKRMADLSMDGVDAELVFPNGAALAAFWSKDVALMAEQFRVYNDWASEVVQPVSLRMNIAACIATGNIEAAIKEVERVAKLGFRVVTLPNKPVFGSHDPRDLNYNSAAFDPFWAAIQECDLTLTFHVSTGDDPRGAKGPGGAVINFAVHALSSSAEPVAHLCASGVLDRFPKLRFAAIESGIGWVPWFLGSMDEAYKKHHMWSFPKLKHGLPSEYFRQHGGATFGEDKAGTALAEKFGLVDNFCWANDYPHHEGTFPHSGFAIEREMAEVSEEARVKMLGLNAAKMFRFDLDALTASFARQA